MTRVATKLLVSDSPREPAVPMESVDVELSGYPPRDGSDSLFEQVAWLYIFFRERLFRDDTMRISGALWPARPPASGSKMIDLGCGPGFYSCRLAGLHPQLSVIGVDRSDRQLAWARKRARALALENCRFERVNVLDIPCPDDHFDALIASRLFTVLLERERAIAEMFRVLQPGGRCFVAEPRHALRASVPLVALWLLARLTHLHNGYREPRKAAVLSTAEFTRIFQTQPWAECRTWHDGRYQYALCQKA